MVKPGDVLDGKYRVGHKLGTGGMGTVFFGENIRIGRPVAIKILRPELADHSVAVERFRREALVAARVSSPHVAEVIDLGEHTDGARFIVLEYLEGESLETRLERLGVLRPEQAVQAAIEALKGLEAVHAAGVVHRDVKPDNVFFVQRGGQEVVKIIDFGVSKTHARVTHLTEADTVVGTPAYMSPEQARGNDELVGERSDAYSMGVVLYEMLSGNVPFHGKNMTDLLFNVVLSDPIPIEKWAPMLDPDLAAIVRRATKRDLTERYSSAREFRAELETWLHRPLASVPSLAVTLRAPATMPPPGSMAKASLAHRPRARTAAFAAAATLVLLGAAFGRVWRPTVKEASASPRSILAVETARATTPASSSSAAPEHSTPKRSAPSRAGSTIRVITSPPGAMVTLASDGTRLCAATPCIVNVSGKPGESRTLAIVRAGHKSAYRSFHVGDAELHADLPELNAPPPAASAELVAELPATDLPSRESPY